MYCRLLVILVLSLIGGFTSAEEKSKNEKNISERLFQLEKFANQVKVGGEIRLDSVTSINKDNTTSGVALRRARIKVKGRIEEIWRYDITADFAPSTPQLKKAYFSYTGFDPVTIKVGRDVLYFGLDKEDKFLEKPPVQDLVPGTDDGVQLTTYGKNWTVAAGAGVNDVLKSGNKKKNAVSVRGTFSPILDKTNVVQIGASCAFLNPRTKLKSQRISIAAISKVFNPTIDTGEGSLTSIRYQNTFGSDLAIVRGPLSFKGEYIGIDIKQHRKSYFFQGGYGEIGYILTGESIVYKPKQGSFNIPVPKESFDFNKGKYGAWEVGARYSVVSLNDKDIRGGKMDIASLALNWYINEHIYTMLNYSAVFVAKHGEVPKNNPHIFMLRTNIVF